MEHIQGFTGSHWMSPSGKCLRRIAPAAAMMVNEFVETTQNITSKSIPTGTKNSRVEGFWLAKHAAHKHLHHDEPLPPPAAWF
jgi:hypothetical protein